MQTAVVWGAASGLGAVIAEQFHRDGYSVIAIARNPDKNPRLAELNIQTIRCDATDRQQIEQVVEQLPKHVIAISTMGSFMVENPVDYLGHRYLIDALEQSEQSRFLLITSLGCGDSWQYLSERAKKGFGSAVREKTLAEAWLKSSQLDYTIVRPGGLKEGDASGRGELLEPGETHGSITRGEMARIVVKLIEDRDTIGRTYHCIDPTIG